MESEIDGSVTSDEEEDGSGEVGVDKWISDTIEDLHRFKEWWQRKGAAAPEEEKNQWPGEMYPGDWDEGFLYFQEYGDNDRLPGPT